ncbi:MAG: pentapeptide repeat-containing protein [Thermoguttaceae bacterium]
METHMMKRYLFAAALALSFWSLSPSSAFAQGEGQTDEVLFYLYPVAAEGAPDPEVRYANGLENADLSFSIWSDAPTMVLPPNADSASGTPVSLKEFQNSWNCRNKRLCCVSVIGSLNLSPLNFDNWTFYRVSIAGSVNISASSFDNALFYRCVLGGEMDEEGNWRSVTVKPNCGITFDQFSKTQNFQRASLNPETFYTVFEYCRLIGLDISDWDFSGKSLIRLEFDDCRCVSSSSRANFKDTRWTFKDGYSGGTLLNNDENIKKERPSPAYSPITHAFLGVYGRRAHYVTPESKKVVFPTEATAEQLYETINYQEHDLRFMQIDLRDVNLSGTTLEFGYVAVYPETVLEGAVIRNATFKASGDAASDAGITNAILYTTKSYRDHNLSGVTFECNLTGCDLSTQNLSAARFQTSDVSGADFTDAVVTRCDFSGAKGLTREQIESTWNYKMGNMAGIKLPKELEEELAAK